MAQLLQEGLPMLTGDPPWAEPVVDRGDVLGALVVEPTAGVTTSMPDAQVMEILGRLVGMHWGLTEADILAGFANTVLLGFLGWLSEVNIDMLPEQKIELIKLYTEVTIWGRELLPTADVVAFWYVDPGSRVFRLASTAMPEGASMNQLRLFDGADGTFVPVGQGMVSHAVKFQERVSVPDVPDTQESPDMICPARSVLTVPVGSGDTSCALQFFWKNSYAYGMAEEELATTGASTLSRVLEVAKIFGSRPATAAS
jgi:hypothetical protein